jgi:hypothetical protein
MIRVPTVPIPTPDAERTARMDRCNGPPTTPHHKPHRIRSVKGACMILSLPLPYLSMWLVRKKCSSIKAMTRRSLTNSSKPMPLGFHSQHGPISLAQVSIQHSQLAHVSILVIYLSIYLDKHPIAHE